MSTEFQAIEENFPELLLPEFVQTKTTGFFKPREDRWELKEDVTNVSIGFDGWGLENSLLKTGFKLAMVWQFCNRSPKSAMNMFSRTKHFFLFLISQFHILPSEISEEHLISYSASPNVIQKGYLSSLSGFLKKWYVLSYPGMSKSAFNYLKSVRLKGNKKGIAVRTMDPIKGPLTVMETESILDAVADAFRNGHICREDFLLAWLFIALGMRPVQYAALKVCDFRTIRTEGGNDNFILSIPRAKQRGVTDIRSEKKDRLLLPEIGNLLLLHIEDIKVFLKDAPVNITQAPLFPTKFRHGFASGYEFHNSSDSLAAKFKETLASLCVLSHRTGKPIDISATRFRRTIGTRAAEEGHGPLVIAEILDHSDTQNVGIYVEATPAIIERIDRAIAMQMAPLAQAFAGKLIKGESEATRKSDPSRRIIDLRIDRSGQAMGSCGQYSHCGFSAPIACYRCACFEPWLDGPHEMVLTFLLERREKLRETTDERIASVNDLTILAVAEVVRCCDELKTSKLGHRNG